MAKKYWMSMTAVFTVIIMLSAACGSSESDPGAEELPINTDSGDETPITESACLPDEPECDDTIGVSDGGQDLPAPADDSETGGGSGEISTGMPVAGGLSVSDALATDASGILAVSGYGFEDGDGVRLCESLASGAERYECGGASIFVENLDLEATGADVVIHDGLTYTQEELTLFGELVEGVFVVGDTVTG